MAIADELAHGLHQSGPRHRNSPGGIFKGLSAAIASASFATP
jgi:hypothetical protein